MSHQNEILEIVKERIVDMLVEEPVVDELLYLLVEGTVDLKRFGLVEFPLYYKQALTELKEDGIVVDAGATTGLGNSWRLATPREIARRRRT